jgi:hypothetical protein
VVESKAVPLLDSLKDADGNIELPDPVCGLWLLDTSRIVPYAVSGNMICANKRKEFELPTRVAAATKTIDEP